MEAWGGAPQFILQKIKKLMNDVARLIIGHQSYKWSINRLM